MAITQIKGSQILDGSIKSEDIDDSLEKDFTKVRVTTDDSTANFLSNKLVAGSNITLTVVGASGSSQTLSIASTGGGGGGGGTPGGSNSQVQFNLSGSFSGSSSFTFEPVTGVLSVPALDVSGASTISGDSFEITGSLTVTQGISGSLTRLSDGSSYLIAGNNITITSASNGSITLSATGGGSSGLPLYSVVSVTGSYTTTSTDDLIALNSTDGPFTMYLQPSPSTGKLLIVKDAAGTTTANPVILSANGGSIDGETSFTFEGDYTSLTLVYTGQNWSIV